VGSIPIARSTSRLASGYIGTRDWGQHVDPVGKRWEFASICGLPHILRYPYVAPSRVLSTSVALRDHRCNNDRHRNLQQTFPGGIFLNYAAANTLVLVLQNVRVLPLQSPLERLVPLHASLATDTHRSRSPDGLRLTRFCRRSNPHRSATLLIGISASPRFPPLTQCDIRQRPLSGG
jgi:hypothetical protein